jgi:hypothetical protein
VSAGMRQNDDPLSGGASNPFGSSIENVDVGLSVRGHFVTTAATPAARAAPANLTRPTVQGRAEVGSVLVARQGTWSGSPPPRLTSQGQRCTRTGARCRNIARASGLRYRIAPADAGSTLRVVVTAANGVRAVTAPSTRTAIIRRASSRPAPVPPRSRGLANLWVHPQQSGSCTRSATPLAYDAARACSTAGAAYHAANQTTAGSLILVRGGLHPAFSISGNRSSPNRIVFDAAPGERPVFGGNWMRIGTTGVPSVGPKYVTIRSLRTSEMGAGYPDPASRFGLLVDVGSRFIRFENVSAGGFLIRGAQDIQLIGGDQGPCRRVGTNGGSVGPCEINKVDHYPGAPAPERILIDRVDFHDFNFGEQGCAGACHFRPMFINGVHGFTMRNSTVRNSVFEPWTTISGPAAAARGNHDILIENNYFGANVHAGGGHGFSFAWCQNASSGVTAYRNVTLRFNSFARGINVAVPGSNNSAERTCRVESFRVYGNILGHRHACGHGAISWSYNVFTGSRSGTCGPGDVNIGRSTHPFYRNDTRQPTRRDDWRLVGGAMAADNRVPVSAGCPATDRLGVRRGAGGFCDAGAHER